MILSMTGYGAAELVEDGVSFALELKSLNHRYLKITCKLPESLQHCESVAERVIRGRLSRGAIALTLRVKGDVSDVACSINVAAAQHYVDELMKVKVSDGARVSIDLSAIASLPGVCEVLDVDESTRRRHAELVERLTGQVVDAVHEMRRTEGLVLRDDLLKCCEGIRSQMVVVTASAPQVVDEYHDRLRSKVSTLMKKGGFELEQDALMREISIYAERCDISEELIRLAAHLDQLELMCDSDEPVGRTMEFLSQELLREANTIASKSNNAGIARAVVAIKGLIDRLKEQIQNVE